MKSKARWILGLGVVAIVLIVGGPWVYINVLRNDAPERLELTSTTVDATGSSPTSSPSGTVDDVSGEWVISSESVVGYRVKEILFGQSTEGVGRTSSVTGKMAIDGATLTAAEFTVDMTSLKSDDGRRDGQFRGRIMDTATYPSATFTMTDVINIPASALTGSAFATTARGNLTLRGQTKVVEVPIEARLSGSSIEVVGLINIVFEEWSIPNPSRPGISTEDNGDLEFQLVFTQS